MTEISNSEVLANDKTETEHELVHMLYDAVADNSLWPEMISELMEHIEINSASLSGTKRGEFEDLVLHFQRAMRLSESIVSLQERYSTLDGILNSLAFGICVFDHTGKQIYANNNAIETGVSALGLEQLTGTVARNKNEPHLPQLHQVNEMDLAIVPASSIESTNLPASAATIMISMPKLAGHSIEHFQKVYYLTDSETGLVNSLRQHHNLRDAALDRGITYESARTYLKRIYTKTGCASQASLLKLFEQNPMSMLDGIRLRKDDDTKVRRNHILPDGRNLEYFTLGPENGKTLLHFDALTGVAIDSLGQAEIYEKLLDRLKMRIIVPCRPGTFNSSFKKMTGLSEFTPDLLRLLDTLGIDRVTLNSQAFGSCSALAFAATAPERVEKSVLCAPSYPRHEPPDWRKMDVFYIIGGVIGRRAPSLMQAIIPFLMRSVMQNTSKYLERHITRSVCPSDINVLSSPTLQRRIPEMLAARTALGTQGLVQENFLNTHGWDFDLDCIDSPVHILQGELDNVSHPDGSRLLHAALPNSHYHSFPELGQYLLFSEWPWILEACAGDSFDTSAFVGKSV